MQNATYGKGVFWRNVNLDNYTLLATDLATGVDCRDLPYDDASLDAVVLDPPYMEGLLRANKTSSAGTGTHAGFRDYYSNGTESTLPETMAPHHPNGMRQSPTYISAPGEKHGEFLKTTVSLSSNANW